MYHQWILLSRTRRPFAVLQLLSAFPPTLCSSAHGNPNPSPPPTPHPTPPHPTKGVKETVSWADVAERVPALLAAIQSDMLEAARARYEACVETADNWEDFMAALDRKWVWGGGVLGWGWGLLGGCVAWAFCWVCSRLAMC